MIADNIDIVHLIQLAVAPVFLLAGVAGLLNVFTSRLTRVIDKLEKIDNLVHEQEDNNLNYVQPKSMLKRREFLVMRLENTNLAIFFCTATGLMVAMVIMSVFLSALLSFDSGIFISILFVLAMIFLVTALVLFLREIYFTTSFIKKKKEDIYKS
jgi:ABC-type multidrug transport system fused ATPase/permease subunit